MDKMTDKNISAGNFSSWLSRFERSLKTGSGLNVACGDCNACCRASQFIHIRPEETATISRIDQRILFPAPGLPKGNLVLGYDGKGCCPLLKNGNCSIYDYRPATCRIYDCRLFAAAGIPAGGREKRLVNHRVRRWRFTYKDALDRRKHQAIVSSAAFLKRHKRIFPAGTISGNPIQLAIMAVKSHKIFLGTNRPKARTEIAQKIISAAKEFDGRVQ